MRCLLIITLLFIQSADYFVYSRRLLFGRPIDKHGFLGLPRTTLKQSEIESIAKEQWFEQKLDHFDPTNLLTWKQRYFINDDMFNRSNTNSPIFLQLGGEGEASAVWLKEGQIATNYGPHYQALQILLEHRYYGQSRPTQDMSTENLKYLTSEQALQDAANFIEFINEKYGLNKHKWIVFGGSYSGSLAAWFRMKYPHLVAGAIASSAPVQAVLDFEDYLKVVDESLGKKCVREIKSATDDLTELIKSKNNWPVIEKKFKLCTPFNGTNSLDVSNFFGNLAGNFEGVVQYNKDNRAFEGGSSITIDDLCSVMTDLNSNINSTDRLAKVNQILLKSQSQECLEFKYDDYVKKMLVVDFDKTEVPSARQWVYQTCTEFGFYQTSDRNDQPFGHYFPLDFFIKQCIDIYGSEFNKNFLEKSIQFTNNFYGGYNLTVSNVMFINGLIDPWHALGILEDLNPTAKALVMKKTAHCADMYPDSSEDPSELKSTRNVIKQMIGKFIQ
ncbi:serine-type peptidase [Dermatophagoides pteronyssinus]|uniref:Serine protease F56F10.1 n=2 Tax=Dermatophagoides pteronyssinus TaxID=6956 RepID=A0A6P6YB35_DERPT|nr:putative serine protease F56F10.1 [Dermatophagoides pteronyssinus]KAH9424548.1 serine-type peptidase [Dermatophagoides pteronyssinus]